jgi:hypothetical protein
VRTSNLTSKNFVTKQIKEREEKIFLFSFANAYICNTLKYFEVETEIAMVGHARSPCRNLSSRAAEDDNSAQHIWSVNKKEFKRIIV